MAEFFAMGGYGFYVWWSYAAAAGVLGALTVWMLRRNTRTRRELEALERSTGRRPLDAPEA